MVKFSKENLHFLSLMLDVPQDDADSKSQIYISPAPKSSAYLRPGDFILFKYKQRPIGREAPKKGMANMEWRIALLVSNKRTGPREAIWGTLKTHNNLVSCFKLDSSSPRVTGMVLKILYKAGRIANYQIKSMQTIFGKDNYRSYILNNMTNIQEIFLPIEK